MYNPGYITIDCGGVALASGTLAGLAAKVVEAIDTNKEIRLVNFTHPTYGLITNATPIIATKGASNSVNLIIGSDTFAVTSAGAISKTSLSVAAIDLKNTTLVAGDKTINGIRSALSSAVNSGSIALVVNIFGASPTYGRIQILDSQYRLFFDKWMAETTGANAVTLTDLSA